MSDFSTPVFSDTSLLSYYGNDYRTYTVNFSTPNPGQTLHVRYTAQGLYDIAFGNVMLVGASLSGTVPPPPQPVTLLNPSFTNGVFRFWFATENYQTYTVEYTSSLSTTSWTVLTNVPGNGSMAMVTDKFAYSANRYYRVAVYAVVPPQPPQPILLSNPSWAAGVFTFSFESESTRAYTIRFSESLSVTNWQLLTNILGNGTKITVTDPGARVKQRFYRVSTQ